MPPSLLRHAPSPELDPPRVITSSTPAYTGTTSTSDLGASTPSLSGPELPQRTTHLTRASAKQCLVEYFASSGSGGLGFEALAAAAMSMHAETCSQAAATWQLEFCGDYPFLATICEFAFGSNVVFDLADAVGGYFLTLGLPPSPRCTPGASTESA